MDDDPAERDRGEGELDDPAELVARIDRVAPLTRPAVELFYAGTPAYPGTLSRAGTSAGLRSHDQ